MLIPIAQAKSVGGLKELVIFRHMGYQHMPLSRDKFQSFGSYNKFKKTQREKIRHRLNPRLKSIRELLRSLVETKNGILGEYDPTLNIQMFNPEDMKLDSSASYPQNIGFKLSVDSQFKDYESLSFTFLKAPSTELLRQLTTRLSQIFKTKAPAVAQDGKKKKNKTLFELIKLKSYEFYQYEPYFALYLGVDYMVDTDYQRDLNGVLNTKYIDVFRSFKTRYFVNSTEVRNLVNNKTILDIQTIIEKNQYKRLHEPFKLERSKIPRGVKRLEVRLKDIRLYLLVAVNDALFKKSDEELIDSFFQAAVSR